YYSTVSACREADVEVEEQTDTDLDKVFIGQLMDKVRPFIKMVKKSSILTSYVDDEKLNYPHLKRSLRLDVKTRWNSSHRMLTTFIKFRPIITKLYTNKWSIPITKIQRTKLQYLELSSDDWTTLSTLETVLAPFYHATKIMSGSQYPTIGIAFYLLRELKEFLDNDDGDDILLKSLKSLLHAQILKYFDHDKEQYDLLKVHAYFDPIGFHIFTNSEKSSIERE
ncbi:unnamed protein product, partial [Didymodactylos carnosus]